MAMTPREEKFIELTDLSANLVGMADNQMGFSTDTDATYNIKEGTPVWRTNNDLHVGAIQYDIDAVTSVATPADNVFGAVDIRGTITDGTPRNGFIGKQSYIGSVFNFVFNESTKVAYVEYTDNSDIEFYVDNVKFSIPDGDSRLTASAIPTTYYGWYTYYFDATGQLTYTTDPLSVNFSEVCLVMSLLYAPDNIGVPGQVGGYPSTGGASISQLLQHHGAESIDWRGVHHLTEGSKIAEPCGFKVTTTSTELSPASILNISAGTMYDEDVYRSYPDIDGTTDPWVVYYYDGITGTTPDAHRGFKDVTNLTQTFVTSAEAGLPGGDANIVYSDVTFDVDGVPTGATATRLEDNEYTTAHVFVGMGPLVSNVIVMGVNAFNSLEEARDGLEDEIRNLYISTTLLSEAVHCASYIVDSVGNIMPLNNDGLMIADYRECEKNVVFGGTDEVVVPNGNGNLKSTRDLTISSIKTINSTTLSHLSSNVGEFPFIGSGGVIGAFDLLGAQSAIEETSDTLALDHIYSGPAYEEILSVTVPSDYISSSFTYSLDLNLPNNTQGVNVKVLINSVEYDTTLFNTSFGSGVNLSQTISDGALTATDVVSVEIQAVNTTKTFTVLSGSIFTVGGQLAASASDAYFVLQENGVGTGTHTFEDLSIIHSGGTSVVKGVNTKLLIQNNENTTDDCYVSVASGSAGVSGILFGDIENVGAGSISYDNSNNSLSFSTNGVVDRLNIAASGNIGIGNTSPSTKLDVNGVITATGGNSTNWNVAYTHSQTTTGNPHSLDLADIGESYSSINYWTLSGSDVYRPSGNIGIGTASPSTKLDVNGVITSTGGNSTNWNVAYTHSQIATGNPHSLDLADIGESYSSINYWTLSGSDVYRPSGRIGIGAVPTIGDIHIKKSVSPTVEIESTSNTSLSVLLLGTTNGSSAGVFSCYGELHPTQANEVSVKNNYGDITFYNGTGGTSTEKVVFDTGGHVGIGAKPKTWTIFKAIENNALTLTGRPDIESSDIINNAYYNSAWLRKKSGYAQRLSFDSSGDYTFSTTSTGTSDSSITWSEKLRITNDGNVGIGTPSPSSALDVIGDVEISGTILQDSWNTVTYLNSWTDYAGIMHPLQYRKGKNGMVYMRGGIANGTADLVCTLPVGYRPLKQKRMHIYSSTATAANDAVVIIGTDGNVTMNNYSTSLVSFDGVCFDID